ncbi:hypothetical protein E2C01_024825 [Portunus trituberculatus]|uniref:Uncharacterized protein n=1 Tax=Portunus trituberculatus TaxID=210409 RepID=A0A5B7EBK9_PORTR|nr:hypothetical protein [Portunus trituberculatus]
MATPKPAWESRSGEGTINEFLLLHKKKKIWREWSESQIHKKSGSQNRMNKKSRSLKQSQSGT